MAKLNLCVFPKPVQLAAHAVGLSLKNPYCRHGKLWYKPYRNRYAVHPNNYPTFRIWQNLTEKGFAKSESLGGDSVGFWLTRAGLDWLGEEIGVHIYDEEA